MYAVIQPYRALQIKYASLERTYLSKEFAAFKPVCRVSDTLNKRSFFG